MWPICYYSGQKKNHPQNSRREERCSTCDIMLDQARSAQGKSRRQSRIGPCPALIAPDRAWYHTWNSVLLAANLEDGSFFFVQGSTTYAALKTTKLCVPYVTTCGFFLSKTTKLCVPYVTTCGFFLSKTTKWCVPYVTCFFFSKTTKLCVPYVTTSWFFFQKQPNYVSHMLRHVVFFFQKQPNYVSHMLGIIS